MAVLGAHLLHAEALADDVPSFAPDPSAKLPTSQQRFQRVRICLSAITRLDHHAAALSHQLEDPRQRGRDDRKLHRERFVDDHGNALEQARHQQHVGPGIPWPQLVRRRLEDDLLTQSVATHEFAYLGLQVATADHVDAEAEAPLGQLTSDLDHQQRVLLLDEPRDEQQVQAIAVELDRRNALAAVPVHVDSGMDHLYPL